MTTLRETVPDPVEIPRPNPISRLLSAVLGVFDYVFEPLEKRFGFQRMAYIFLLPNMLIFGIFILLPMLLNFYYGFTAGDSILLGNRRFIGTDNIAKLLDCASIFDPSTCNQDRFWRGVGNTGLFVVTEVALIVVFGLITALALNRKLFGRGFFRSMFFYPVLLSPVVVALIWKWLLHQDGLLNAVIVSAGGTRVPFLLDGGWAQFWVIVIGAWAQMGFFTLILLAGLQSIPPDLYEAGQIDGTNPLTSFRFITLPLLMPTMFVVLVLSIIRAVQIFDHVYVLTNGGPGSATLYIVQYIYTTAFQNRNYGLAAAASLLLALVLMILTVFQLRLGRRVDAA